MWRIGAATGLAPCFELVGLEARFGKEDFGKRDTPDERTLVFQAAFLEFQPAKQQFCGRAIVVPSLPGMLR